MFQCSSLKIEPLIWCLDIYSKRSFNTNSALFLASNHKCSKELMNYKSENQKNAQEHGKKNITLIPGTWQKKASGDCE